MTTPRPGNDDTDVSLWARAVSQQLLACRCKECAHDSFGIEVGTMTDHSCLSSTKARVTVPMARVIKIDLLSRRRAASPEYIYSQERGRRNPELVLIP